MNRIVYILNKIPHSPQLRQLVAFLYFLQAFDLLVYFFTSTLTISYFRQILIMPIEAWGIITLAVGLFLLVTKNRRYTFTGRMAALLSVLFSAWHFGTFMEINAYTAVAQYGVMIFISLGEAVYVDENLYI